MKPQHAIFALGILGSVLCTILFVRLTGASSSPPRSPAASASSAGSGSAGYLTGIDEDAAAKAFATSPPAKDACRQATGASCPPGFVLVASCVDGHKVYAPAGNYVRGRKDTGGYERRITDPEPIVVPMSFDWCAR